MQPTQIQVSIATRGRLFTHKGPGVTYDDIINAALDSLEEQQKTTNNYRVTKA